MEETQNQKEIFKILKKHEINFQKTGSVSKKTFFRKYAKLGHIYVASICDKNA